MTGVQTCALRSVKTAVPAGKVVLGLGKSSCVLVKHSIVENGNTLRRVAFWTVIGAGFASAALIVVLWYRKTRRVDIVEVTNKGTMLNVQSVKAHFSNLPEDFGPSETGRHLRIANERRRCEESMFSLLASKGIRFRDVGGSRTRGTEFAALKHLCAPTVDSSDIFRNAKQPTDLFDRCNSKGQDCPVKNSFPGAVLVHSDYYMTRDDLVKIVNGHTFILTHKFDGAAGKLHGEMEWSKVHDKIEARTADGTVYRHAWNEWESEGCCVGKNGAFCYATVWENEFSRIVYAYPAPGCYVSDDPNNLRRSDERKTIKLGSGNYAVLNSTSVDFYSPAGQEVGHYDRRIFEKVVFKCGGAPRDEKFLPALASYLSAKLVTEDKNMHMAADLVELATVMCHTYAIEFHSRNIRYFDPNNLGLWGRVKQHVLDRARDARLCLWSDVKSSFLDRPVVRQLTPWVFSRREIPSYVMETKPQKCRTGLMNPGTKPFPNQRLTTDAKSDDGEPIGTGSLCGEYGIEHRDESVGRHSSDATTTRIHETTQESDVHATRAAPAESGAHCGTVSKDAVEIRNHTARADKEENGVEGHHVYLLESSDGMPKYRSKSVLHHHIVLESPAGGKEAGICSITVPPLYDPVDIDPDKVRYLREQDVRENEQRLRHSACAGLETLRHTVQGIIRTRQDQSKGHAAKTLGGGVPENGRDGVAQRGHGTARLRKLGKTVPRGKTNGLESRAGQSPPERGPGPERRHR